MHPDQVMPLEVNRNLLLYKDPPDHTKYRKILQTAFVPNTVARMEQGIRDRVTRVLDEVIEAGGADFVEQVAVPLPLGVLAEMMGLPDEAMDDLYRWTHEIEEAQLSAESCAAMGTFGEMAAYLHEQIAVQAERGGDSLVMRLRAAEVDGERLDDNEILVFFALLVFAGNDTTRNTASAGMLELLRHPDQWRLLCEEPERIPAAVEEILRFTSVVNYFCRTATRDTEVAGQPIAAGEKVMLWYTSASRDVAAAEDPARFDVTRESVDHKAFGGGGRHFCLGAGLARLELRLLFEELAARMPSLQLAGDPVWLSSAWAHSLTALPVAFSAGSRRATPRR
jgi:cytochrome P450